MQKHQIIKVRREPVYRTLKVQAKEFLTPRMLRIRFHSQELEGFVSPSPDDHIKVFFPAPEGEDAAKRDFTPRAWDLASGTLTIDFALHEYGAAAQWAKAAKTGDLLQIAGPRGSTVVPDDFDWYLLIGDASAIPSFARRLEGLRAGVPVYAFIFVADKQEVQYLRTQADYKAQWLLQTGNSLVDAAAVLAELDKLAFPAGDMFTWIAGEATFVRNIYQDFVGKRGFDERWIKASAYWTRTED